MNGDKSPVDGQPQSGTVVDQSHNSSRSTEDSPMDPDWRAQLTLELRQRMIDRILETLEKHLPSVQEGNQGLKKIAGRYEEKIYSAATTTSRSDYRRKISLTMHALERNSQVPMANSLQTGAADASGISSDLASNSIQNLGLSMPIVGGESQASQNMENSLSAVGVQNSGSLASTFPAFSNLTHGSLANAVCQDSSLQNNSSVVEKSQASQNMENNLSAVGMQNSGSLASTPPTVSNLTQGSLANAVCQDSSLPNNSSFAEKSVMTQPTMMLAASISSLQSSGQQSFQQMPDKLPQSVLGQNQQQPTPQLPVQHQQQASVAQQPMMQTAQQAQLQPHTGQVSSDGGIQQNQLLENIQFLRPGLGLMSQQNKNANLQQEQSISQLNNITNTHQLQLGGGVSNFQQSTIPGMQSISSSEMLNQQQNVPVQQNVSSLQNQTQQTQAPQPQTVSHVKPQLVQLPHLQLQSNSLLCDPRQKLPTSGSMLQQKNLVGQEKQFNQSEQAIQKASTSQTESSGDWKDEVYQKIMSMKDAYFVELNAMDVALATRLQMYEGLPQPPNSQLGKLKFFRVMIERLLQFLQISKKEVQKDCKDKLGHIEKQITSILSSYRPRNPTSLQPGQRLQPIKQNSQLQSQISQMQTQPLNPQTSAAIMTENTLCALPQNMSSSVPINGSLMNYLQQPSSTFGLEQNSSPLSLQLPQLGMQNSQPPSRISQMPTQPSSPQTSSATMVHTNFGALHLNTLSSVPSNSNSMTNHVQQPSLKGLGQNSSMLSPQHPQGQYSQPQCLKLQQTSATSTTQKSSSALNQNMLYSVPSSSNSLMNSMQQPSFSVGFGQNSSLISPHKVSVNSLQQNIALSGPQSSNPVGPLLSSQAGVNALMPNLNSLSYTRSGLLQQQQMLQQQQLLKQQQMYQQQLMNQHNLVTSLTKTETPFHTANPSVVVPASSTPVAALPKLGESEKVNASPLPLSENSKPLQATKGAGSSNLTQAPEHPSLQINQHNSATSLTKTWKPLHSADSLDIVPPTSTHIAPSSVHDESEKVITSLPSHPDTVTGHIQAPNSAGSLIANTNAGRLEVPIVAGSSVLPLSIFIGDSEIVSASLSSQPNTHILHLEVPNPTDSSAKPLAISFTISIA